MTLDCHFLEPDELGPAWAPFGGIAPLATLRVGAWSLADRWGRALEAGIGGVVSRHLADHHPPQGPAPVSGVVGPAWVVDSTFAPKVPMRPVRNAKRLMHEGRTVAWRLEAGERWEAPFDHGDGLVVEGLRLRGAFDLVTALEELLFQDVLTALDGSGDPIPSGTTVIGNPAAILIRGTSVEPGVVFDTTRGGVVLEPGAIVRSGTRLEGPSWIGHDTWILGGKLRHVSAGPHCRLHGEISTTAFSGYANKSHDGFLGHSMVGEWVNLGAGTITSNLKNTYGPIRLDIGSHRIETERTNLGSLIGDHVKTAIGTLLPTGAVVGVGANIFGVVRAPKYVRPFAWGGDGPDRLDADAFLEIARRVMPRRDVAVTPELEGSLRALHQRTST